MPRNSGKQKTAYEISACLVGSEMCIRDREISPHFQNRLKAIGERYEIIGDARGMGLLGCLEGLGSRSSSEEARLKIDTEFGQLMDEACEKRGLLVRPIINMCVFSPPLVITRDELDTMFDILEDAITEVKKTISKF